MKNTLKNVPNPSFLSFIKPCPHISLAFRCSRTTQLSSWPWARQGYAYLIHTSRCLKNLATDGQRLCHSRKPTFITQYVTSRSSSSLNNADRSPHSSRNDLPSQEEGRRSHVSKSFSHLMDHVQSNIFIAGQRLNDLTGYSGIEALRKEIEEQGISWLVPQHRSI